MMKYYYKLNNFLDENGQPSYKGLELHHNIPGSQVYPFNKNFNVCVLQNTDNIQNILDVEQITEEEYNEIKEEIYSTYPKPELSPLEEKLQVLTENLAQEKINNMKKDTLAVNLTKEVASLKIEVMNLKKGSVQ